MSDSDGRVGYFALRLSGRGERICSEGCKKGCNARSKIAETGSTIQTGATYITRQDQPRWVRHCGSAYYRSTYSAHYSRDNGRSNSAAREGKL